MVHLKMIFRSWWRNKLSTFISVVSLTVGLVCSTMLILFVLGEYKVASALGNSDRVYLIESQNSFYSDQNIRQSAISPAMVPILAERTPQISKFAIVQMADWRFDQEKNTGGEKEMLFLTSAALAQMLDIPVRQGNLFKTLSSPGEIAVSDEFMLAHFGRVARLGDVLTAKSGGRHWINGVQMPVINVSAAVTTILEASVKTPLTYGALAYLDQDALPKQNEPTFESYYGFVELVEGATGQEVNQVLATDSLIVDSYDYNSLTPWREVYLDGTNRAVDSWSEEFFVRRDPALLSIGLSIAIAVLLIAAFNYVNITMTRARERLRNIAAQRIFGASARAVRWQTVLDTMLIVGLSFALALMIIDTLTPQFNAFMDSQIKLSNLVEGGNLAVIVGLLALLVLLPSAYILWKIEVHSPMDVFKNTTGRGMSISSVMVVAQLVVSIVLVVVSLNIVRQMTFVSSQLDGSQSILRLKAAVRGPVPAKFVEQAVAQSYVVGYSVYSTDPCIKLHCDGLVFNGFRGDEDLVDFYNMQIVEGRNFAPTDSSSCVIVNEKFLIDHSIKAPAMGQIFDYNGQTAHIVGVVKDFMFEDAHKEIGPAIIEYHSKVGVVDDQRELYLRVSGDPDLRTDHLRNLWAIYCPGQPLLEVKSVAKIYTEMHSAEERLLTMVNIFVCVSGLLTVLGLFGLAFYTVGRRTREIALRKIHGSTSSAVVWRLCRIFGIWVGVACVVALPVGYLLSRWWLSSFAIRVPIVWWVFAATVAAAALVTLVTVIYQTYSAANANPAKSIKTE